MKISLQSVGEGLILHAWPFRVLIVFVEMAVLGFFSTQKYANFREHSDVSNQAMSLIPALVKAALVTAVVTVVIDLFKSSVVERQKFLYYRPCPIAWQLNAGLFLLVLLITVNLEGAGSPMSGVNSTVFAIILFLAWLSMLYNWGCIFAPRIIWRATLEKLHLFSPAIFILVFLAYYGVDTVVAIQIRSMLIYPTLSLASKFYSLTGAEIFVVGHSVGGYPIFGNQSFNAEVQPACSGYEGIFLSIVFLGVYFYLASEHFSLGRITATILIASVTMFSLNAIRIAALMYVGIHFSPEVAQNGFHTNFGLITLVGVLLTAYLVSQVKLDSKLAVNLPMSSLGRLLLPIATLIAASLLVGLFSGKFYWFYPLPILLTAIVLYFIRDDWDGAGDDILPFSASLAVITFFVWITIIPPDPSLSHEFEKTLFSVSAPKSVLWLIFRIFGSVLVVPLAEELAFRGAFFQYLVDSCSNDYSERTSKVVAVAATSLAFGLTHSNIVAGTMAGVAFGLARLKRNRLGDAVMCHSVTNLLLAIYVITSGSWSYW